MPASITTFTTGSDDLSVDDADLLGAEELEAEVADGDAQASVAAEDSYGDDDPVGSYLREIGRVPSSPRPRRSPSPAASSAETVPPGSS